ncbi:replication initiator [Actinoallomurus sp. CA-150999]|uniref:replication initiator n=1 Tax=Actinoallomurus sp. CA-150999 TaxID=3239887 RepID=UPI003D91977D
MSPVSRNPRATPSPETRRATSPDYHRWTAQIRRTGGCAQPIHLRGRVDYRGPLTGALLHRYSTLHEPDGVLRVACKTRRASRCPSCAEVYRADSYQLVRAGPVGGKGVPATVTAHPAAFVTLTAPSFGYYVGQGHTPGEAFFTAALSGKPLPPLGPTLHEGITA